MSSVSNSNDPYSSNSNCYLFHNDSGSNSFANFDSLESDNDIEDLPSFSYIFKIDNEIV
jgi:hypothetical protein